MAAAAPTGCYKCGRPGHWSRDCPSAAPGAAASTDNLNPNPKPSASRFAPYPRPRFGKTAPAAADGEEGSGGQAQSKKKKKERATRPKLTPDLLLSDDGLGFVLRYFPKAFKPRARPGHEVEDLGNLIKLYTDWHSRLIPYYSFDQFVRKVEKVGASNRVRRCISELRERVARGGDPTLLHEPPVEVIPEGEPDGATAEDPIFGTEAPVTENHSVEQMEEDIDPPVGINDVDPTQEDLLNEIYEKAAVEPQIPAVGGRAEDAPQAMAPEEANPQRDPPRETQNQPAKIHLTEEQRARMEANRLKALERAAAARARASQPA
ncbi:TIMELESS-interacting protein [Oryza brachyantha]|uniref:CCHC-type domain-containing protein n=1 Tax=Oryza brachyantha TaxID=4533 RepID=J3LHD0_ORYBR|nr:TIMELESS-interacting protein [Oryza brachyantha]